MGGTEEFILLVSIAVINKISNMIVEVDRSILGIIRDIFIKMSIEIFLWLTLRINVNGVNRLTHSNKL